MAFLIKATGQITPLKPRNGKDFQNEELHELIGCELVQIIRLLDGYIMIVDESGALKNDRVKNPIATEMYHTVSPSIEEIKSQMEELKNQGYNVHYLPGNDENFVYGTVVVCKAFQYL